MSLELKDKLELVGDLIGTIRQDIAESWEVSRPEEPHKPIIREQIEEWKESKVWFPDESLSIEQIGIRGVYCSHVLYKNVANRRASRYRFLDALLEKAESRVDGYN